MTFSFRRFNAIFIKELQDFKSNLNYVAMCSMPVFFSIIYKIIYSNPSSIEQAYSLVLTTMMSISLIGVAQSAGTFSEEKEKHTLRVLMLSPISEIEIFLGKTLVTYFLILISSFANFFILNTSEINIFMFFIVVSLTGYGSILLGIAIGMLAPSEKTSGVLSLPALFIYLIPLIFSESNNSTIKKIVNIFPANNSMRLLIPKVLSVSTTSMFLSFINLVFWIVFGLIFFIIIYRRKKLN